MVCKISDFMATNKDTLFKINSVPEDFEFNTRVVEVFDDMLDRSVPFYRQVIQATASLLNCYLQKGDAVYDLGSSTGTTLLELSRLLPGQGIQFIGVDSSQAMLDKARLKVGLYSKQEEFDFIKEDITQFDHLGAGAVILHYTLQFIRPLEREALIQRIYDNLRPGGILLLSEKTICHEKRLNREFIEIYHNFKKERGYSELEIAKKREALENILIPFSIDENKKLLKNAGFQTAETYFQWFNFTSLIATKTLTPVKR